MTRKVSLAKDKVVHADVRRAAESADAHRAALELAALHLWGPGVDIIYDVWWSTNGEADHAEVNKRAKEFLEDGAIRTKASKQLRPTLDLQRAIKKRECKTVKSLVVEVGANADVRALPSLEKLRAKGGCGFVGWSDCWPCLRGGEVNIGDAIDAVKGRAAPTFDG